MMHSWIPYSWKTICLSCIVNAMASDGLVTQGAGNGLAVCGPQANMMPSDIIIPS